MTGEQSVRVALHAQDPLDADGQQVSVGRPGRRESECRAVALSSAGCCSTCRRARRAGRHRRRGRRRRSGPPHAHPAPGASPAQRAIQVALDLSGVDLLDPRDLRGPRRPAPLPRPVRHGARFAVVAPARSSRASCWPRAARRGADHRLSLAPGREGLRGRQPVEDLDTDPLPLVRCPQWSIPFVIGRVTGEGTHPSRALSVTNTRRVIDRSASGTSHAARQHPQYEGEIGGGGFDTDDRLQAALHRQPGQEGPRPAP